MLTITKYLTSRGNEGNFQSPQEHFETEKLVYQGMLKKVTRPSCGTRQTLDNKKSKNINIDITGNFNLKATYSN